jgi:hypothetical protein
VFATVLLGIAATDARRYLIPDGFTVFLLVWTLGTAVVTQGPDAAVHFAGPYEALVGACAGRGRSRSSAGSASWPSRRRRWASAT